MFTNKFFAAIAFFLIAFQPMKAQQTISFENVALSPQGVNNGSDLSGGFTSGDLFFRNYYDPQFFSWEGFSASNKVDSVTAGFSNQYSCYAGSASEGSKFGMAYIFGPAYFRNINPAQPKRLTSLKFTNSTYAALSMKNGDAFSKKFGGASGNDPDFFKIRVFNHFGGQITDSAEIFLADFRSSDNTQDYIVKSWRLANFSFNNPFDSISFKLQSTDNGQFGMNTPSYFCLDEIVITPFTSTENEITKPAMSVFPNPFQDKISLLVSGGLKQVKLINQLGKEVQIEVIGKKERLELTTENLPTGIYYLKAEGYKTEKLFKN
jgi:hypothetical protein